MGLYYSVIVLLIRVYDVHNCVYYSQSSKSCELDNLLESQVSVPANQSAK